MGLWHHPYSIPSFIQFFCKIRSKNRDLWPWKFGGRPTRKWPPAQIFSFLRFGARGIKLPTRLRPCRVVCTNFITCCLQKLQNSNNFLKHPWHQSSHLPKNSSSSLSKYRLFSPGLALLINLCRLRNRRPESLQRQRQRAHRLPRMKMLAVPMIKSWKRVARAKPATPKSLVLPPSQSTPVTDTNRYAVLGTSPMEEG